MTIGVQVDNLPHMDIQRMVALSLPGCGQFHAAPLEGGLRNTSFKVSNELGRFVLRIYEHDEALCQKEVDLLRVLAGSVPVPEVVHASPTARDELPPFAVLRYVDGITFRELKRGRNREAIAQAAAAAGETLAAIGKIPFEWGGWIAPGPAVTTPLLPGENALPRFVDLCLDSPTLQRVLPENLRQRGHALMWEAAAELAALDRDAGLVHCDFGSQNLIVRQDRGRWRVAAVLDWEFAVVASPLTDVGHFLRYENEAAPLVEPHFSKAFAAAGGALPDGWRRLARLIDFSALCEILTRDGLPEDVVAEVTELAAATVRAG